MTNAEAARQLDVTYYTVSDEEFFLGTVMLLNSLRVTGNTGRVVVLDGGLAPDQRALLEDHAEVLFPPHAIAGMAGIMKPYPHLIGAAGTVVVIDSDIVVTGPLDDVFDLAHRGKIIATPAWTEDARRRWFPEWEETLGLRAPLRREDWFHNGFVVLSTDHWPLLLERWWQLCELVPPEQAFLPGQPFNAPDADAINALLMSEVPREALALLPPGDEAFGGDIAIEDVATLRCTLGGRPVRFVHYPDSPKPWQPGGWVRAGATAYARIMRRLLFAPDLPVRVEPEDAPLWIRPTAGGRAALAAVGASNRTIGLTRRLPEPMRNRIRDLRRTTLGRRGKAAMTSESG
jgi:hypothetical protein